jgi:putative ABC transport system permease protein
VAIKYQIAIILAIFAATELATLLCILLSQRRSFDAFGFLRRDVLK